MDKDVYEITDFNELVTTAMKDLQRSSTPGYPLNEVYSTNGVALDHDGISIRDAACQRLSLYFNDPLVSDSYDSVHAVRHGYCDPVSPFIKNEPHPPRKAVTQDFRAVTGMSVVDQIVDRVLFHQLIDSVKEVFPTSGAAIGIGFTDEAGSAFAKHVLANSLSEEEGYSNVSSDVASWDSKVGITWLEQVIRDSHGKLVNNLVFTKWFKAAMLRVRCVCDPLFVVRFGTEHRFYTRSHPGAMLSGWFMTTFANTVARLDVSAHVGSKSAIAAGDDCVEKTRLGAEELKKEYSKLGFPVREVVKLKPNHLLFCSTLFSPSKDHFPELTSVVKCLSKVLTRPVTDDQIGGVLEALRNSSYIDAVKDIIAGHATRVAVGAPCQDKTMKKDTSSNAIVILNHCARKAEPLLDAVDEPTLFEVLDRALSGYVPEYNSPNYGKLTRRTTKDPLVWVETTLRSAINLEPGIVSLFGFTEGVEDCITSIRAAVIERLYDSEGETYADVDESTTPPVWLIDTVDTALDGIVPLFESCDDDVSVRRTTDSITWVASTLYDAIKPYPALASRYGLTTDDLLRTISLRVYEREGAKNDYGIDSNEFNAKTVILDTRCVEDLDTDPWVLARARWGVVNEAMPTKTPASKKVKPMVSITDAPNNFNKAKPVSAPIAKSSSTTIIHPRNSNRTRTVRTQSNGLPGFKPYGNGFGPDTPTPPPRGSNEAVEQTKEYRDALAHFKGDSASVAHPAPSPVNAALNGYLARYGPAVKEAIKTHVYSQFLVALDTAMPGAGAAWKRIFGSGKASEEGFAAVERLGASAIRKVTPIHMAMNLAASGISTGAAPASYGSTIRNRSARITETSYGVMIEHCEYVMPVMSSVTLSSTNHIVNPANSTLFPWLASFSHQYEGYRFDHLRFTFASSNPTGDRGAIFLCFDYDESDPNQNDRAYLMNLQSKVRAPLWEPTTGLTINPALVKELGVPYRLVGTIDPTNPRSRDYNIGRFIQAVFDATVSGGTEVGELYVDYRCHLLSPHPLAVSDLTRTGTFAADTFLANASGNTIFDPLQHMALENGDPGVILEIDPYDGGTKFKSLLACSVVFNFSLTGIALLNNIPAPTASAGVSVTSNTFVGLNAAATKGFWTSVVKFTDENQYFFPGNVYITSPNVPSYLHVCCCLTDYESYIESFEPTTMKEFIRRKPVSITDGYEISVGNYFCAMKDHATHYKCGHPLSFSFDFCPCCGPTAGAKYLEGETRNSPQYIDESDLDDYVTARAVAK